MSIMKALSLLATESWNTERPDERDHWRELADKGRAELDALRAENAELRERCKAIASDADNWKRLACTSDKDLNRPVEMDAAEREHYERGKDITGCDV